MDTKWAKQFTSSGTCLLIVSKEICIKWLLNHFSQGKCLRPMCWAVIWVTARNFGISWVCNSRASHLDNCLLLPLPRVFSRGHPLNDTEPGAVPHHTHALYFGKSLANLLFPQIWRVLSYLWDLPVLFARMFFPFSFPPSSFKVQVR